jgi:hypothetical protein
MSSTTFSGPVTSTNGFVGNITGTVTGNALVETVTSTNVLTAAESGTTYFLSALAGFATTLPAPASGLNFSFIVITAPTSNGYTIGTNAAADIMSGTHSVTATGGGSAIALADIITLVANSAVAGDRVDVVSNGTYWYVTASSTLKASITSAAT